MILTTMTLEEVKEDGDELGLRRIVKLEGPDESICMDLRAIAHGLRIRIEERDQEKQIENALRTMFETAFAEGLRMTEDELKDKDREYYTRLLIEAELEEDEDPEGELLA